jgi:hypothetical protein
MRNISPTRRKRGFDFLIYQYRGIILLSKKLINLTMTKQKEGQDDQKISTGLGTIVLVIIAITVFAFVFKIIQKREVADVPQNVAVQPKPVEKSQGQQNLTWQQDGEGTSGDAVIIKGWKKYTSADESFSIEYPGDWQINGKIFTDINGKKIAAFLPGPVTFQPNQECFDSLKEDPVRMKIVSKSNIEINKQQGVLIILKVIQDPGGGTIYPNTYCIKKESKAFIMAFYDYDSNFSQKELFNKVMSTLEFK